MNAIGRHLPRVAIDLDFDDVAAPAVAAVGVAAIAVRRPTTISAGLLVLLRDDERTVRRAGTRAA